MAWFASKMLRIVKVAALVLERRAGGKVACGFPQGVERAIRDKDK